MGSLTTNQMKYFTGKEICGIADKIKIRDIYTAEYWNCPLELLNSSFNLSLIISVELKIKLSVFIQEGS